MKPLWLISLVLLVLAVFGGLYFNSTKSQEVEDPLAFPGEAFGPKPTDQAHVPSNDAEALKAYNIVAQVPRLAWNPDRPFALWAIEQDRPVILTNSAVHRWPALKKWTPQYLAANSRNLPLEFKSASDPVFIYSQRKPLNRVDGFEFSRPFNFTHLDLETFWNRVSGQQDDIPEHEKYLYFTGCLTRSQDELKDLPGLIRDITPFHHFSVEKGEHDMNLWLGSPGVVAHTHHDEVPNWAAQVYGHKRWILSPPSEAWKIYPYPYLHSFRSQSQIDFKTRESIDGRARATGKLPELDDNDHLFPDFVNVTAYEALLSPGEIMYIPPFWFHRVVTEDTSIAVNTWSNIPGGNPHNAMEKLPLPFEDDWDLARKSTGLRVFATILGSAVAQSAGLGEEVLDPAFSLLHKQYDSLYFGAFGRSKAKTFRTDFNELCHNPNLADFEENITIKINEGIYIPSLMEQLNKLKNPDARRLLFLGYLETAIYLLLEDPNFIYPFIRDCIPKP
jgi:hypoxia-inducible factor 1-alpha inhibitor (HIF hydroxylase)